MCSDSLFFKGYLSSLGISSAGIKVSDEEQDVLAFLGMFFVIYSLFPGINCLLVPSLSLKLQPMTKVAIPFITKKSLFLLKLRTYYVKVSKVSHWNPKLSPKLHPKTNVTSFSDSTIQSCSWRVLAIITLHPQMNFDNHNISSQFKISKP